MRQVARTIAPAGDILENLASFRRHLLAANLSQQTIRSYHQAVSQLARFLAEKGMPQDVASLTREHVEAFVSHLLERWKPATASTRYRGLKVFFTWLQEEGEITADGKTRPMTAVTVLSDYREVEGMLHPFQVHITATGLSAGMSEEDAEEARKGLEEMEKNLEGMDASQRAMVERMMGPQMEKLLKMLETGQFEITVITKEVRVNE